MQFQCQSVALRPRVTCLATRLQNDLGIALCNAPPQRLCRVLNDIEQSLYQLCAVASELGNGDVIVARDLEP
jgi:hypothetical protein